MVERRTSYDRRTSLQKHPVIIASTVFLVGVVFVLAMLCLAQPILFALAVSLALFTVLSPAVVYFRQRGWATAKAAGSVMVLASIIVSFVGALLYPTTLSQIHDLSQQVSHLDQQLESLLTHANIWLSGHDLMHFDPHQTTVDLITRFNQQATEVTTNIHTFFAHVGSSLVLIPLITFFLLCDFHTLRNQAMQLLPNSQFELGWLIYTRAAQQLQNYIRGISIQAIIIASFCTLGFWIVGVDYAPLLGIMIGLLNTIPFFGISLAKIPPVLVVLLSKDPSVMEIVLALSVVLAAQALDNGYIIPRIVAKAASLHPLTVIISVMLSGYYAGFFGLMLSVPVVFSLKVIHVELVRGIRRQAEHRRLEV
ncbi:MAG: AI-2E family transporter [Mariprofundales bacterium]|nr:AI-2E family transporter [Mariprofundales bacterium]